MGREYVKSIHRMICGSVKKEEAVKAPDFYCESCSKRCENRCTFYNRYIVKDYNRCFNHSLYAPTTITFKIPDNLEEIIQKEEKQVA